MTISEQANGLHRTSAKHRPLRWWPAALLVVAMALLRKLPDIFESPSLSVFMLGFMGPAGLGMLVMLWWIAASRAHWKEKIVGLAAVLLMGILTSLLCHFSMQGMGVTVFLIPVGIVAFAIPLILLANRSSLRLPVAIVCSAIGFGGWDLVKSDGVSGKFESGFSWRWASTAEERYLENRAKYQAVKPTGTTETPITLASSEWPGFRGAVRDGKVTGVSLNEDWNTTPPKLIWKKQIGPGWSSFSVAGKRLFTQEQRGELEAVVCLDAESGRTLWEHENKSRFWEAVAGAGPRATPTIADEGLFSLGANGILTCLNASSGVEIWKRDIEIESNRKPPMWGFSSSPLVIEGVVVVHAGGLKGKGILAYDAKTGEPRWSTASGDHSYCSPQLASFDSVSGILMETNAGLQFVNAIDGSKIWQFDAPSKNYRTLQPLVFGDSVLLANSLGEGTKRIKVSHDDGQWTFREEWSSHDIKPSFNDFVEFQGNLFGFDSDIFVCVDMAIEGKTWNHSVVVGNMVFIRNGEQAACYEMTTSTQRLDKP